MDKEMKMQTKPGNYYWYVDLIIEDTHLNVKPIYIQTFNHQSNMVKIVSRKIEDIR